MIKKFKNFSIKILVFMFMIFISYIYINNCYGANLVITAEGGAGYRFYHPSFPDHGYGTTWHPSHSTIDGAPAFCTEMSKPSNSNNKMIESVDYTDVKGISILANTNGSSMGQLAFWMWQGSLSNINALQYTDADHEPIGAATNEINAARSIVNMPNVKTSSAATITINNSRVSLEIINNAKQVVYGPYRINGTDIEGNMTITKNSGNGRLSNQYGNVLGSNTISNNSDIYFVFDYDDEAKLDVTISGTSYKYYSAKNYTDGSDVTHQPYIKLIQKQDNISIPLTITKPIPLKRRLYVEHGEIVGGVFRRINGLASNSQIEISSDGEPYVRINTASIDAGMSYGYQEFYRYRQGAYMKVASSLGYNGTYRYVSGKMVTSLSFNGARNAMNSGSTVDFTSSTINTPTSTNEDHTIVRFIYEPITSEKPTPYIHTISEYYPNGPISNNCDETFVPSGERLKPYLITTKYYNPTWRYELQEDVTPATETSKKIRKPKYVLKEFKVQVLKGGDYGNNSDTETNVQNIIIGGDKTTLINNSNAAGGMLRLDLNTNYYNEIKNYVESNMMLGDRMADPNAVYAHFSKTANYSVVGEFTNWYDIPKEKYNGLRRGAGDAKYATYDYNSNSTIGAEETIKAANKSYVNVYTPITIGDVQVTSNVIVDHTIGNANNNIIQKNADFTVTIGKPGQALKYTNLNTSKYVTHYYIIFDIDILTTVTTKIRKNEADVSVPLKTTIPAGTPIRVDKNGDIPSTFTAKATNSKSTGDIIDQLQNTITVIGAIWNMPEDILESKVLATKTSYVQEFNNYMTSIDTKVCDTIANREYNHSGFVESSGLYKTMVEDAYYFANRTIVTDNIGRIYDFKITDCTDVNFKDVFRKISTATSVNDLTGNVYYSGMKVLKIYTDDVNTLEDRNDVIISNKGITKNLPLGPYKHVSDSYVQAPKMGYKISFDLKTSGKYETTSPKSEKWVEITPSYYYISKNGDNFLDNISLYYKESNGKYKNFKDSNYSISFKPNDGYRSVYNNGSTPNLNSMSTKLENLNLSKPFTLNKSMMSYSDDNFIQAWYGEFKLPNSTIALGGTNNSLNNPLKDGYIGVKFDIVSVVKDNTTAKEIKVAYGQKDEGKGANTTQWDYESYLGINSGEDITASNPATIKLEKKNWTINNQAFYEKIRGTVVFFDLDNRAANDFD